MQRMLGLVALGALAAAVACGGSSAMGGAGTQDGGGTAAAGSDAGTSSGGSVAGADAGQGGAAADAGTLPSDGGAAALATCADVTTAYTAALADAIRCDAAAPSSCGVTRPSSASDPCRCAVAVNPARTAALDDLLARWDTLACTASPPVCNRACLRPATTCGADGTCSGY